MTYRIYVAVYGVYIAVVVVVGVVVVVDSVVVVSVVVPSTIDTALNRKSMPDANPAKWVKPEQLADVIEFICSDKGFPVREAVYKVYNDA